MVKQGNINSAYFLKMGQPRPLLSFIFGIFKQTSLQNLQQINAKKCPSSIRCQDLNPWSLEHESPPISTRPGLPPNIAYFYLQWNFVSLQWTTIRLVNQCSFIWGTFYFIDEHFTFSVYLILTYLLTVYFLLITVIAYLVGISNLQLAFLMILAWLEWWFVIDLGSRHSRWSLTRRR